MNCDQAQADPSVRGRTLTVYSFVGLTGRLRALLSGMALAAASGRRFRMYWPRTSDCGASFRDLYCNDWPVEDLRQADVTAYARRSFPNVEQIPDLLMSDVDDLHITRGTWLVRTVGYEPHAALVRRCGELFDELVPTQEIRSVVESFEKRNFRPKMIGVHARRGDFASVQPDAMDSTQRAIAAVNDFLTQQPDAGVLLCTDDGAIWPQRANRPITVRKYGVLEQFAAAFGDRLVHYTPRSLNRQEPIAVADSLIELLLLRRTNMFVGTSGSGFSDFAIYQRDVPYELVVSVAKDAAANRSQSGIGGRVVRLLRHVVRRTGS